MRLETLDGYGTRGPETQSPTAIKGLGDSSVGSPLQQQQDLNLSPLLSVLEKSAHTTAGLRFVSERNGGLAAERLTYASLWSRAQNDACSLISLRLAQPTRGSSNVLLYFNTNSDNIRWFWAVLAAGGVPCIAPPFVSDARLRRDHIAHLIHLLENPTILTTEALSSVFEDDVNASIQTIESLPVETELTFKAPAPPTDDGLAVLMLTSGSTGNAKAVCLNHEQMLQAAAGKSAHSKTNSKDVFLNWIGLDHVANLVEIHLHAMSLGAEQVHVQASHLLADPLLFPRLINQHRVSVTFAPNFFLDLVVSQTLEKDPELHNPAQLDLSSLRALFSGGETNVVKTAVELTRIFQAYGTKTEFICPGYGLTESCAGLTWGFNCPSYDVKSGSEFTSAGAPIPGGFVRVVNHDGIQVPPGEIGDLQLSGPVIFKKYYRNPEATKEAFTQDGWFITGDQARIDSNGQLHIVGRVKDTINMNGVKYFCSEVETAIEQIKLPGVAPSCTVVFPHRPQGASTEEYCIVYKPTEDDVTGESRAYIDDNISRISSVITNKKPFRIIPLPESSFYRSSLGKLSRAKFRKAFEAGDFQEADESNRSSIHAFRMANRDAPSNPAEESALNLACDMLGLQAEEVSVTDNIFHLGFSSLDINAFACRLQKALGSKNAITLTEVLRNPTIRSICTDIDDSKHPDESYDPVVVLQPNGDKTPFWIVHPASGNVLVFIPLSRYLSDRPVYGLRARGVRLGERFFGSVDEMATTYFHGIKRTQPEGPYAIAGYSLGSSVAFEVAKLLIANGDEVRFVGALDSPPDIAPLVGNLTWSAALVMVSFFLGLIPERYSNEVIPRLWNEAPDVALEFIMSNAEPARLEELQLDRTGLSRIADIAHNFGMAARKYEPVGSVPTMDVFVVDPLLSVTEGGRKEWHDKFLYKWKDFVTQDLKFHQSSGSHADMLGPKHVRVFQRILQDILVARGL
ncbi:acetyl-CoA synthetase-like protein [Annulohypoxylon truncatum]|uniref:acetyl-CoA synthetase-like protein n=1 Tax=Annulohypoxylon truncatum TaxID=327061 RepID=UPI002008097A|nr:acetyl-CoA synthetase-like protein [Annulohypoxylon truncatum]KAI1212600.1 acetyl-CoA synthetase-like protein [Annulohypoxylon truncatum]